MSRADVGMYIVDMEGDFEEDGALAVAGGKRAGRLLADMYERVGHRIGQTYSSVDVHPKIHIANPHMWRDGAGNPPPPFTVVTVDDIRKGVWIPRNQLARPKALGGRTIRDYVEYYAEQLAKKGNHDLIVWPEHCTMGTPGCVVDPVLMAALNRYCDRNFTNVYWIAKGQEVWVDQYGGFFAEVPLDSNPNTGLNPDLLAAVQTHRKLGFGGLALTHCVVETLRQLSTLVDDAFMSRIYLLADASPGIPGFEDRTNDLLAKMQRRGMNITTTTEFLA